MKRYLLILSIISLLFLTCGCQAQSQDTPTDTVAAPEKSPARWDEIIKSNEIRIGIPSLEDSMDNRLIDAFEKESGITVKKVVLPWDSSLADHLNKNEVEMLWGQLPATSDSSSLFRLSNPYFHSNVRYLATKEDLAVEKTTKIGVLQFSVGQFMTGSNFDSVTVYNTSDAMFSALLGNRVDCILCDDPTFQNMKADPRIHTVKEAPYDLVVAFQQNNTSVASEAEKIIARIKADGTASDICLQWYQNDYIKK